MGELSSSAVAALLGGLGQHPHDGFYLLRGVEDERGRVHDFVYELASGLPRADPELPAAQGTLLSAQPGPLGGWLLPHCLDVLRAGQPWSRDVQLAAPVGVQHGSWYEVHVLPGDERRVVCHFRDITTSRLLQSSLAHQAAHDPLTRLPTRQLLMEHLQAALARLQRTTAALAVLFCDLDGFKVINDGLGHSAGDEVLVEVASRMASTLRPGDIVARFGGDEFVMLLLDLHEDGEAITVAERLRAAISGRHRTSAGEVALAVSIGLTVTISIARTAEQLLSEADAALYEAKRRGRGNVQCYTPELHARASYRQSTELELDHALHRGELRLHYQPKCDLLTGGITAVEALLRWQHPTRGLLLPGQFLAIAEDSSLILDIGSWVLHEACRVAVRWARLTDTPPEIDVNLAARQIQDPHLFDEVMSALTRADLDPGRLEVEVTETQMMTDLDHAAAVLGRLRGAGVKVALDDFGTGHSSLTWLQRFPVTTLKLDLSFVQRVSDNSQSLEIVRAVIALAHAMNLLVVAEGIETEVQKQLLVDLGADLGQGFHLARPMTEDQLAAALTATLTTPRPSPQHLDLT